MTQAELGKAWCDEQRMRHLEAWLWTAMKKTFQVESMRNLQPALLVAYAREAEIEQFLPECYREAES